jgi:hypothetical protein
MDIKIYTITINESIHTNIRGRHLVLIYQLHISKSVKGIHQ